MTIKLPKDGETLPDLTKNQALIDALANRRSTKLMQIDPDNGPSDDELHDILQLATRVPDHGKLAPWRIITVKGDARLKLGTQFANIFKAKHKDMEENHYKFECGRYTHAHTILVLISNPVKNPKVPEFEQLMSAGSVGFALNLAAYAFGYTATWLTDWPAFDEDVRSVFKMTEEEEIIGFFFVGKPKVAPIERERPDLGKIVSEWK